MSEGGGSTKATEVPRPHLTWVGWRYVLGRVVREFFPAGILDKAAMLTFFTVLSFAPTLLAVYSIATLILANNADLVGTLVGDVITEYVPAEYQETVRDVVSMVLGSSMGGILGLIAGVLTSLWSASAYVRAFSRCSNHLYGQAEGRTLIRTFGTMLGTTLLLQIGMVIILAALVLNESVVSAVLGPIAGPLGLGDVLDYLLGVFLPVWRWARWPVILVLTNMLIAVMYYYTPNVKQPRFRWLSWGAVVAMAGIGLVAGAFWLYLSYLTGLSSYGAIGTVLALMFALWGANISLVLGVKVDAEVERARQLKAGIPAERDIQLPLRGTTALIKQDAAREKVEERGRELRGGT